MSGFNFVSRNSFETMRNTLSLENLSKWGTRSETESPAIQDEERNISPGGSQIKFENYHAKVDSKAPAVLTWHDVCVQVNIKGAEDKLLINHIDGTITGGMWAIMGPSGSGKVCHVII